ncbi:MULTISPECIES: helix-turn-helix domain-containing protein [unclassified Archaeoglobus]|jgi:DNA-binding Lrp family transcriptional regulator|uniref:helix-turn-helix domain-containing protein n=1 Tax=unclassified Archaeoglobus TaxID=2643606 RepID=UPI0025C2892A|nr:MULTISPECIES: helix-turn-helix domain-containing protein [unclassified Archaeoglobus]
MSSDLFSFKPASEVKKTIFDTNREIAEIEDLLEICRICDKDKRGCRSCFIWQELHNKNCVMGSANEQVLTVSRQSEVSQKFFDNIVKKPLGRLSKSSAVDISYINISPEIVKKDDWRNALNPDFDGHKKISKRKIKTSERSSKGILTIGKVPRGSTVQRKVTSYTDLEKLDEFDCKIITLMNEDHHQAEIARILGKSRQVISYRVKKILKTGLVKVLRFGKFIYYKPSSDLLNLAYSKLNEIEKENKNTKNKALGRAEGAEPNRPNQPKQPAKFLSDVHHITATVKVNVSNAKALRLKCQNCPKFREGHNCKCKGARYVRMNNWDFHAVNFNGYEISVNNGREITVTVRGVKVLVDFRNTSVPPSDQIKLKVKDTVRSLLEKYFDRFWKNTGIEVMIDWDDPSTLRIKGVHLVLEENEKRVHNIQKTLDTQTAKVTGDIADVVVDESPDDDGSPQPHIEAHVKDLQALDYYHDLLNGKIHEKLSQLEAALAPAQKAASIYGGTPVSTEVADLIRRLDEEFRDLLKKQDQYTKQSSLLKREISEIKALMLDVKKVLEALCKAVKDIFFETFVQLNNKHVGELNRTLSLVAHLLDKIVTLEKRLDKLYNPESR